MNLPNLISLGRLFSAPLIVWLIISQRYNYAFWLFCCAGLSDLVDGLLARVLKDTTTLGKYLDPIADKTLIVSVIISLGVGGLIPSWLVIIVVFRDVLILGGILIYMVMNYSIQIKPIMVSKINTLLQIFCAGLILFEKMQNINHSRIVIIFFILMALTTILSGLMYVKQGIKGLNYASPK